MYHQTIELIQDETLLIQQAKKSPERFGPLYKKYHEAIFRFIYQRMDDKDLAFDLTSQVFIKAMNNIHRYEDRGVPFSSWLYRIAKSELYQSFRNKKTDRFINIDSIQLNELVEDFDQEDKTTNISTLMKLIEGLKEQELQLIEMRFFEKRSYREIGEILEMTENNAKVKTFRVIEKLKKLFVTNGKK